MLPVPLKLAALDSDDLEILSAHMQDAVLRVADMSYQASARRFALIANRFDWSRAVALEGKRNPAHERRRTALRFDCVNGVKLRNIRREAQDATIELLAIRFEETDKPAGQINLVFAGGGEIELDVECIEAEMKDLGAIWRTPSKPDHSEKSQDE